MISKLYPTFFFITFDTLFELISKIRFSNNSLEFINIKCVGVNCIASVVIPRLTAEITLLKQSIVTTPKTTYTCHFIKRWLVVRIKYDCKSCDISMELRKLWQIIHLIDTAIQEARRYWMNLQQLNIGRANVWMKRTKQMNLFATKPVFGVFRESEVQTSLFSYVQRPARKLKFQW